MSIFGPNGFYVYVAICLTAFAVMVSIQRQLHTAPTVSGDPFRAVNDMSASISYEIDSRSEHEFTEETSHSVSGNAPSKA